MRDYAELVKELRYCGDRNNLDCKGCSRKSTPICDDELKSDAADAIEELLAAVPKWISVEERLPDKHGRYLCRVQNIVRQSEYYTQVLNFEYGHFSNTVYFGGDATNENVSHWMPLPEPPKEVER